MCLVFAAYRTVPGYALVVVANRDEYYARATAPMHWWEDAPAVLAGRDLEAGGTWLGVARSGEGRFATLTNYREGAAQHANPPSRGALVSEFLTSDTGTQAYMGRLGKDAHRYNGFNLLAYDGGVLGYCSNRDDSFIELSPGLYGLSNHLLDTPWPKVQQGKAALARLFSEGAMPDAEALFDVMGSQHLPPPEALPSTGVSPEFERVLSPVFVRSPAYGTRSSAVVALTEAGDGFMVERLFDDNGRATATTRHEIAA